MPVWPYNKREMSCFQTFIKLGLLLSGLLLVAAGAVRAAPVTRMAGLLVGGGILSSHLSERRYAGMSYDLEWAA